MIAGGGVRAVLELAGIHDILSKSLGTQNPINLVKATVAGLRGLRTPEEVAKLRGLSINQVLGLGGEPANGAAQPPRRRRCDARGERDGDSRRRAGCGRFRRRGAGLMSTLTVTQRRSSNGANGKQLDTLRSLGLRRIGHTVEVKDSEQARGMLHAVRHLVEVEERQVSPAEKTTDEQLIGLHSLAPAPGQPPPAQAHRARRRLGHRQDLRPRPEGRRLALGLQEPGGASRAGRCRSTCACESCAGRT